MEALTISFEVRIPRFTYSHRHIHEKIDLICSAVWEINGNKSVM